MAWILASGVHETLEQVAYFVAAAFVAHWWWRERPRLAPAVRRFVVWTLLVVAWQVVSPLSAQWTSNLSDWPTMHRWSQWLDTLSPLVGLGLGLAGADIARVMAGGVGVWTLNALIGWHQHWVEWTWNPPRWITHNPVRMREMLGDSWEDPRFAATGLLFHRLRYAHGALAILGPTLAALRGAAGRPRAILVSASLMGITVLSYSRAALVAALTMGGAALVLALVDETGSQSLIKRLRRWWPVLPALPLVTALPLLDGGWQARIRISIQALTVGDRSIARAASWAVWKAHPLLGAGFGNHCAAAWASYRGQGLDSVLCTSAHLHWLTVAAETGIVGVVLQLGMHVSLVRALWPAARAGAWMPLGALVAWVGYQTLGLAHYPAFHPSVMLLFGLIWGLGLAEAVRTASSPSTDD